MLRVLVLTLVLTVSMVVSGDSLAVTREAVRGDASPPALLREDCSLQSYNTCSGWIWVFDDTQGAVWGVVLDPQECPGGCQGDFVVTDIWFWGYCWDGYPPAEIGGVGVHTIDEEHCLTSSLWESGPMTTYSCVTGDRWTHVTVPGQSTYIDGSPFAVTVEWGPPLLRFSTDNGYGNLNCWLYGYTGTYPGCATSTLMCTDWCCPPPPQVTYMYVTDLDQDGYLDDVCDVNGYPYALSFPYVAGYGDLPNNLMVVAGLNCDPCPNHDPETWNGYDEPNYQECNNCYNYATSKQTHGFAQVGRGSGTDLPPNFTTQDVVDAALSDGLEETTAGGDCRGNCKAALVVDPGCDWHWLRLGYDGYWSHKLGTGVVSFLDDNGDSITDPEGAVLRTHLPWGEILCDYDEFGGYFCVPPEAEILESRADWPDSCPGWPGRGEEAFFVAEIHYGRVNPVMTLGDSTDLDSIRSWLLDLVPTSDPGWDATGAHYGYALYLPEYPGRISLRDSVIAIYDSLGVPSYYEDTHGVADLLDEDFTDVPPRPGPRRGSLEIRMENSPSVGEVRLSCSVPERSLGSLEVFDVTGRRVRTLERALPAGRHMIAWDGRDAAGQEVASGIYFMRLETGEESAVERGILLR